MSLIVFENQGVIDARSIRTFGISVKESENPIGYFGTGLKYAIAILLRSKQEIKIISGLSVFEFKLSTITVRDKEFQIITMNGEELPFTTELGKNWELWQAFREIYCNCLDEGGSVVSQPLEPLPDENKTYVIVNGREFTSAFHDRESIVLNLSPSLMIKGGDVDIYNKPSKHVYYRGIRVMQLSEQAKLTYNIKAEVELTEDRTLKSASLALHKIPIGISGIKDRSIIRDVLTAERGWFENGLDFSSLDWWEEKVSPEFMEVLATEYNFNNDRVNKSAIGHYIKVRNKNASKNYEPADLTPVESMQLKRCKAIAERVYPDFSQYQVLVVKSLGQSTMALADFNNRMIVMSKSSFQFGSKFLLSTLIEEYIHLKTNHRDHTRELQTYLFDQLATMIENYVIGEPI